jgi:hypothetical protein
VVKQPKHYFEAIFGINAPWSIQDVAIDEKNKIIQLELTYSVEKSRFSFLSKSSETDANGITEATTPKRWVHTSLGQYSCYVSSSFIDKSPSGLGIGRSSLTHPSFIGETSRNYTHQLRQQVALAHARGLANDAIANLYKIEINLADEIISDINSTPESYRLATCLPTEADPIWEKIITDKFHLKTQLFSLKLLLSKLKLTILEKDGESKLAESVTELRKFFIAHTNALDTEYMQICALSPKKAAAETQRNAATKLVLPALKNSIWLKLITGKIDLKSTNMSLNLFLVRLRHAFQNSADNNARVLTLNSLREFFKKNARSLKPELVLINKLMNAPEETQFTLPNEQHDVWKRILKDDSFIPSSYMAYKLLLSNLRSQLLMNPDPVVELDAARKIRDFINHNQRFMQQELRLVLRNSYAN